MKRTRLILALLLLQSGCWRGIDSPDIHIKNATQVPKEALGMKDTFQLPDDLTDVCYFSPNSLMCNYYLRGRLSKVAIIEYETDVLKDAQKLTVMPENIYGRNDIALIADWWPSSDTQNLRFYKVRDIDYVMIDPEEGFLYIVMCAD